MHFDAKVGYPMMKSKMQQGAAVAALVLMAASPTLGQITFTGQEGFINAEVPGIDGETYTVPSTGDFLGTANASWQGNFPGNTIQGYTIVSGELGATYSSDAVNLRVSGNVYSAEGDPFDEDEAGYLQTSLRVSFNIAKTTTFEFHPYDNASGSITTSFIQGDSAFIGWNFQTDNGQVTFDDPASANLLLSGQSFGSIPSNELLTGTFAPGDYTISTGTGRVGAVEGGYSYQFDSVLIVPEPTGVLGLATMGGLLLGRRRAR